MIALTLGGQAGAGALEVGNVLAKSLDARYIRHLALRRIARRLSATADAVSRKELSFASRWRRAVAMLESVMNRMGYYACDPSGFPIHPSLYVERPKLKTFPAEISDREYVTAVYDTAAEFASEGDLVLVKRAGPVTLRRFPQIVHVGLFASRDFRVARMARRLGAGVNEATEALAALEVARRAWFRKLGGTDPEDPALYDMTVRTDIGETDGRVAWRVIEQASEARPELSFRSLMYRTTPLVEYPQDAYASAVG